ncbi:MAG: MFS transporter [Neisseriaceae bacterium]
MEQANMRRRDWLLLLSLSNFKFTIVGFYMVGLITMLKQSGFSLNQLSWVYLLAAVELGKVFFSLFIERFRWGAHGHFRFWLLCSTSVIWLALGLLWLIDPQQHYALLLLACFTLSVMSVVFGCATLGLNCALLSFQERGFGGVIQVLAARLGKMIGGGLVLLVYQRWGWHAAIGLVMGLSMLIWLQLYRYRTPLAVQVAAKSGYGWRQLCGRIVSYWRQPNTGLPWLWLLLFSCMPYGLVATTFIPQLSDLGWTAAKIGTVLAIYVPIACVAVAPLAGVLMRRYTRHQLVLSILLGQTVILSGFIFLGQLSSLHPNMIMVLVIALSMGYTLLLPIVMALFMDKASAEWATLDSSLQFTVMIGGAYVAGFLSLRIANASSYQVVYVLSTVVGLLVCALTLWQGKKLLAPE